MKEKLQGCNAPRAVTPAITVRILCKSSSLWWSPRKASRVAYEVFDGDTADVTTLEEIVSKIESKYGMRARVWVFDRGIVSEDNLQDLRQRGAYYLVGTPRRKLADFERELLEGDWQEIAGKPGVRVQLLLEGAETFVVGAQPAAGKEGVRHAAKSTHRVCTALCAL